MDKRDKCLNHIKFILKTRIRWPISRLGFWDLKFKIEFHQQPIKIKQGCTVIVRFERNSMDKDKKLLLERESNALFQNEQLNDSYRNRLGWKN